LQDKLNLDSMRHSQMLTERQSLKSTSIKTLVESEIQRSKIKQAVYQMQVWNTFHP